MIKFLLFHVLPMGFLSFLFSLIVPFVQIFSTLHFTLSFQIVLLLLFFKLLPFALFSLQLSIHHSLSLLFIEVIIRSSFSESTRLAKELSSNWLEATIRELTRYAARGKLNRLAAQAEGVHISLATRIVATVALVGTSAYEKI